MALIEGTSGNDDLFGTDGDDTIRGLDGDDTLSDGDETAPFDDLLEGGMGNDVLFSAGGTDTLDGGAGDDDLTLFDFGLASGGDGNDTLYSGRLDGQIAANGVTLDGGAGIDALRIGPNPAFVRGGAVDFSRLDGSELIVGDVTLRSIEAVVYHDGDGNGLASHVIGTGGNDDIDSRSGPDTLEGGAGDDTIFAYGTEGTTGAGVRIEGGDGDDLIRFGSARAADTVDGGAGIDLFDVAELWADRYASRFLDAGVLTDGTSQTGPGPAQVTGMEGFLFGTGDGRDQGFTGTAWSDHVGGGDGDDTLNGLDGDDTLRGDAGADALDGGGGADLLIGGGGGDVIHGGAGADLIYGDAMDGGAG